VASDVVWIIDYKSATPSDDNSADESLESFLAAECQRYYSQLADYKTVVSALYEDALPVRCALFFTGLGQLKEL
jgi:ATP-dependent exoDNAse (exonuclease V) beta subunit